MTGDGTNDAAAIRTADIGIGLAARGSVAAREAADLIITGSDERGTPPTNSGSDNGRGRRSDGEAAQPGGREHGGDGQAAQPDSRKGGSHGQATQPDSGERGSDHDSTQPDSRKRGSDESGLSAGGNDHSGETASAAGGIDLTVLLAALVEGRDMWRRVRDAIGVLVGGNAGEVTFTVLGTVLSGRAPIGTRQFLLVNLLTDLGPAMAVALSGTRATETAVEPDDTGSELRQLPRPDLGGDFLRAVAVRGACTTAGAGAAWLLGRVTGRQRRAATMALAALIATQLGQTLVIGRHSPLVWVTVAGSAALLAGVIMTPGVNSFFGCVPLGPVAWTIVTGCAAGGTVGAVYAGHRYTRHG
ncbi:cation transporting ATPase C-terminal domain-containing protein [Nocardia sp. 2]|uniref:Cation transporting ATPase C-terminal domain-containing protein n=2 Tax=Nocardia acididurans TaxID=2802282 RepID=A0ABS1MGS9_9NOCA|nr:cation transporting ATPase C-terminal domain-containing protein [Nocardia acididurans]